MKYIIILVYIFSNYHVFSQSDLPVSHTTIRDKKFVVIEGQNYSALPFKSGLAYFKKGRLIELVEQSIAQETLDSLADNHWHLALKIRNDSIISCACYMPIKTKIDKEDMSLLFKKLKSEKIIRTEGGPQNFMQDYSINIGFVLKDKKKLNREWY